MLTAEAGKRGNSSSGKQAAQQQGRPEGRRGRPVVSGMVAPAAASEHFWHKLLVAGGASHRLGVRE